MKNYLTSIIQAKDQQEKRNSASLQAVRAQAPIQPRPPVVLRPNSANPIPTFKPPMGTDSRTIPGNPTPHGFPGNAGKPGNLGFNRNFSPPPRAHAEEFPEEEYAPDFPDDDSISFSSPPRMRAPVNSSPLVLQKETSDVPSAEVDERNGEQQYVFEDEGLSQPHPDEVPLEDEEEIKATGVTEEPDNECALSPAQLFSGFKRKAVSQPEPSGGQVNKIPPRNWSQPSSSTTPSFYPKVRKTDG
eukprot:TRINITY_DN8373_c0_g1_i1.p1 TRINITY_DN8373_c0_g1~~TRINITY_DN8373_c0_g1_i1.p1  ORF type:complete len:244 (-),score=54.42 TRINITY_DN8373_c0_g1_i1:151-882(-)